MDHEDVGKTAGGVWNWRTNRDHSKYSISKIGQNTEKNPKDLRSLALIQTPMKDHQLTLALKTQNK